MRVLAALLALVACAVAADYSARRAGITGVGTGHEHQIGGWTVLYVWMLLASLVAMTWVATEVVELMS